MDKVINAVDTPTKKLGLCCGGSVGLATLITVIVVLCSLHDLGPDEQILIHTTTGREVVNGPRRLFWLDPTRPQERRQATSIGPKQYARVLDELTGEPRIVAGKHLLFLNAYDKLLEVKPKVLMEKEQYAKFKNRLTGDPFHKEGPQLFVPGPFDDLIGVVPKIVLQKDEYIRLVDQRTGEERIVRGPETFVPEPLEVSAEEGIQKAVFLGSSSTGSGTDAAVLVLDRETGHQRLVQQQGIFFPGPYEQILAVRELVRVQPHESVIVRDSMGRLTVHSGTQGDKEGTAFFLPPYCEFLTMRWSDYSDLSASISANHEMKDVVKIDMRARIMFFSYEVRTSDNVKLKLEGNIFWQVQDVPKMVSATSDPEGDVWHHARSALIQSVSKVTLSVFMSGFNGIVMDAFSAHEKDGFYVDRGVQVQSMEVTRYECVDQKTAEILQEIIQETTNRINRLQEQESENEVRAASLEAEIDLERQRTELIKRRAENLRLEAQNEGESEGEKVVRNAAAFMSGLNSSLPSIEGRVELYKMHQMLKSRNTDTSNLASGDATLFLTPEDMNLKLNIGDQFSDTRRLRGASPSKALTEL